MVRRFMWINLLFIFSSMYFMSVMARHAHHYRSQERDCYSCPPGEGVLHKCNRHHDTECQTCLPGFYSSHHSSRRPCYPCSRCGVGLYVAHECTPTKDTVCDSCHTYRGPHNEDFHQKCVVPLTELFKRVNASEMENLLAHQSKEPIKDSNNSKSWTSSVTVVAVAVSVSALAIIVTLAWLIVNRNRRRKVADSKYTYHAVSTQDVVML